MIDFSPQASRQVFVNRPGRAAACTHGQNDNGRSSHDVAAGEDTPARGALGLRIGWFTLFGMNAIGGVRNVPPESWSATGRRAVCFWLRPGSPWMRTVLPGLRRAQSGIVGSNLLVTIDAYGTGLNKVMGLTASSINNHRQSHMNRRINLVMRGRRQWQRNPKSHWIISATSSK